MKRSAIVLGVSVAAAALAMMGERDAKACGGCFVPPTQVASDITDERMLLTVSKQQTTLYDQIRYAGSPASFAWVLPIHGTVDVGLSADVLFDAVDALSATKITQPASSCPSAPQSCQGNAFSTPSQGAAGDATGGGVTVTKQENVGPYATVQLHSTDASALENWLAQNNFAIPADEKPILAQYVSEGFDFLAMKLIPGAGVQSMRPVRVTAQGASLSLPLRMAAIGTGATVGITIWVVSDGRYEPQNFPIYRIEDKDLVWDWKTSSSNYTALRAEKAAPLGGRGWEMETSIDVSKQLITSVILSGGIYYSGGGPGGPVGTTANASDDYLPIPPDGTKPGQTADQVRTADIATLFAGLDATNVRVTRMRSDIAHAAMNVDFVLQASSDQSQITNVRNVTTSINESCPIYQGCKIVGQGSPEEAAAAQNSGGHESFGCATGPARAHDFTFAALAGLGLVGVHVARRRRKRQTG
jgi:Uncharacterized protein conserved in bacteria (DUF2330)